MAVDRLLPSPEAADLLALTREIAHRELETRVVECEAEERYPEGLFATLGAAGLLGLPVPRGAGRGRAAVRGLPPGAGGAGRPLGRGRALRSACTACSCFRWRPSDAEQQASGCRTCSAASCSARTACPSRRRFGCRRTDLPGGAGRRRRTHQRHQSVDHPWRRADYYTCSPAPAPRLAAASRRSWCRRARRAQFRQARDARWGCRHPDHRAVYEDARVAADRLIGREGQGLRSPSVALDSGRLGIAAVATGLAQAALDDAVA